MLFGATKPTRQPVRGTKRRHKPSQSEEPANKYAAIQDASASNSGNPQPPRLRRKPWYLCMPDERKFTCAAVTNEVTQGLLHIFIRHHQQLEHYVPMLRRLRLQLPREVKTLLRSIGIAVNMEAAEEDVSKFRAHIYNEQNILHEAQQLIVLFLQTTIATTPSTKTLQPDGIHLVYNIHLKYDLVLVISGRSSPPT